jgi:hypothetical protein
MMHRFALFAAVAVSLFAPLTVLAAAQRTFVASNGSDTWPCTRTQPCRSFATAIGKTSANGEVLVLDSAGYGPFMVAQSISVIAPSGVYAGITVTSGAGITINGSGIVVTLRGLSINGQGGQYGIHFLQGAKLTVESCEISGMTSHGIVVKAIDGKAVIQDTVLRDNYEAVLAYSTAGTLRVSIVDSKILNNSYGVESYGLSGSSAVTVSRSTVTGHLEGLRVHANTGYTSSILSDGNTFMFNDIVFIFSLSGSGVTAIFTPGNNTVGYFGTLVDGGALTSCCGV